MKTLYKTMMILTAVAAMTACGKESQEASRGKEIGLYTSSEDTRADADETGIDQKPLFLFWTENNFNDGTKTAPDFFVCTPTGVINDYATTKYNTGVYYPINNRTVYSVGIAPVPGEGFLEYVTSGDYSQFAVTDRTSEGDDKYGAVDILAADRISGTNDAPFATALKFHHLATKIAFKATLYPSMAKAVKYVTITFPGSSAPKLVVWNGTDYKYEIAGGEDGVEGDSKDDFEFGHFWTTDGTSLSPDPRANATMQRQLSPDRVESIGFTHIVPPGSSLDFTVNYKVAEHSGDFDTPGAVIRDIHVPVHLDLKDGDNNPLTLEAGDAYTITMKIDLHDIELIGKLRPWVDGGYVDVPFQPTR